MIPPMRKTNEASLFSYNGESINEGEQRKAAVAVAVAVAAVVTVELQIFLMAAELYLCIVNGDVAPTRRPYRKYMSRRKSFPAAMILSSMDRSNRHSAAVLANLLRPSALVETGAASRLGTAQIFLAHHERGTQKSSILPTCMSLSKMVTLNYHLPRQG